MTWSSLSAQMIAYDCMYCSAITLQVEMENQQVILAPIAIPTADRKLDYDNRQSLCCYPRVEIGVTTPRRCKRCEAGDDGGFDSYDDGSSLFLAPEK